MRYAYNYVKALRAMGRGSVYYIPCLGKSLVLLENDTRLDLDNSILNNAKIRGHLQTVESTPLAIRYELSEKGKQELMDYLEVYAWQ